MAARKHQQGFTFPAPPTDPHDIREVPIEGMAFVEANTPSATTPTARTGVGTTGSARSRTR